MLPVVASQNISKAEVIVHLKDLVTTWTPQVSIDQKDSSPSAGEHQSCIAGHHRLTFGFKSTGEQGHFWGSSRARK